MSIHSRLIAAAAIMLFLVACLYVGYVNELLKGAVATPHRIVLLAGFLIGAASSARFLMAVANRKLAGGRSR
jgi:hypothetical protein